MAILVTLEPTISRDHGAIDRLCTAIERKLGIGPREVLLAILPHQERIKANARAGLSTTLRLGVVNGAAWAQLAESN